MTTPAKTKRAHRRRVLVGALVLLAVLLIMASSELHGLAKSVVDWAGGFINDHPVWGAAIFVVLAALSAMLAFFSSVLLVPVGVGQWGLPLTASLLWLGWTLGGLTAYCVGRFLGPKVVRFFVSPATLDHYASRINRRASFFDVLLIQSALPSEIPGYLLGLARYPVLTYLLALAIAELPYAIGSVILGQGFLERQYLLMIAIGAAGLGLMAFAAIRLKKFLKRS